MVNPSAHSHHDTHSKQLLHLYLITWNAARNVIPGDTTSLLLSSSPGKSFTENIFNGIPHNAAPPDVLVLALQEAAPIAYAFLGGEWVDPYIGVFENGVRESARRVLGTEYVCVGRSVVGMTAVVVFVRSAVEGRVGFVEVGGVRCGLWGMGNKGGVGVRIGVRVESGGEGERESGEEEEVVEMSFVSAHLAPHEWLIERRNEDWRTIVEGMVFERVEPPTSSSSSSSYGKPNSNSSYDDGDGGDDGASSPLLRTSAEDTELSNTPTTTTTTSTSSTQHRQRQQPLHNRGIYSPTTHAFIMGDLNYRTSPVRPLHTDRIIFPKATDSPTDSTHFTRLLETDQCRLERAMGRTLHGFEEAEITFPPTYKYKVQFDATTGEEVRYDPNRWEWSSRRWPSWTDRILYLPVVDNAGKPRTAPGEGVVPIRYTSIPEVTASDHKPVTLYLSIPARSLPLVKEEDGGAGGTGGKRDIRYSPPFQINRLWRERGERGRRLEVVVGVAAYLATTTRGVGVVALVVTAVLSLVWFLKA
ncbi:Endonuclease/exonuclease/phosphatase [Peziza echinospora]|nr:Endonuclease/exonuclease/phosphatase [Peziza echinospora]